MRWLLLNVDAIADTTKVGAAVASKSQNLTWLVLVVVALAIVVYFVMKKKRSAKAELSSDLVEEIVKGLSAERIERLSLSDVVNYFKSLSLKNGVDTPFVCITDAKAYLLATYNESSGQVEHCKLLYPNMIDDKLKETMGNEKLVVLH